MEGLVRRGEGHLLLGAMCSVVWMEGRVNMAVDGDGFPQTHRYRALDFIHGFTLRLRPPSATAATAKASQTAAGGAVRGLAARSTRAVGTLPFRIQQQDA
jgi:hypothetical protein